jgi:hypothetical protein
MRVVHFKNFFGPGALCFDDQASDPRTPIPEQVTCLRCLGLMGRSSLVLEDEELAVELAAAGPRLERRRT